ncbi:MAG: HAMP domain-containing histidine kinase [Planctomycetales bacterium]|nr:HAMP domain-containing histidine kinase [Planctomycetales bacterium]
MSAEGIQRRDYGRADDNLDFTDQEHAHRYRWAAFGLALGVILMPLGGILDWTIYPEQFVPLMTSRLFVTALLAVGLMTRKIWSSGKAFEPVSFTLILLPGLFICWMMYLTDGSQSRYYFGLILLMILLNLLGFRATEAAAFCGALIIAYAVAVLASDGFSISKGGEAIQGFFFLSICSTACVSVCYTYRKSRFEAFCLNRDLAAEEERRRRSIIRLRDTEHRLVHSEKMRAIAGVAAGLLHEINNPVNFSLMAIKVLKRKLPADAEGAEMLGDIEAGVTRIGDIITDLQSFAHPDQFSVQKPFVLREAIDTSIRFLTHELPDGRVEIDESDSIDETVLGAQSQIVQVLLNVILNAEKAIRATGSSSNGTAIGDKQIIIRAVPIRDRLAISISDSGVGMDEAQLQMVKQPFFTTRSGEGLGLGLGICETIVQSHGGTIEITSQLGVGTTVTFDLPLADNQPTHVAQSNVSRKAET